MKKSLRFVITLVLILVAFFTLNSCQSTNQESDYDNKTPAPTQKESSGKSSGKQQIPRDIKITVVSSPKETMAGKAFSAPYKILVTTESGTPYSSFTVTAEYPSSRTADSVSFKQETIVTDENGSAIFTPEVPQFAVKSEVSFYPQFNSSSPDIAKFCSQVAVTAPWLVRTNATSRTGILVSILDYKPDGKMNIDTGAQPSTQALEAVLWKNRLMGAQNADFHNSVDANDPARIRSDALKLIKGNTSFVYVIYGRVKYAGPVTQDADGFYTVTFNGDVGALNINSGEVLIKASKTVTVKEKNQWKLINTAQEELAKLFGEELIYGL